MKKIIALVFILVVLNPVAVYATNHTSPVTQQPPATATTQATTDFPIYQGVDGSIRDYLCTPSAVADGRDLERCINRLYRFGISAGALVLVFMVVAAGYLYITGGETGKGKGKAMLMNSLVGMGILLGSYVLLYFINPTLVAFKPIQPPIFDAKDLPSCEEVGLGNDCVISVNEGETSDQPTTVGTGYANCSGGIVPISGIPRAGSGTRICKDLLTKMQGLVDRFKSEAPGYYFAISSTIRNGNADSRCHYDGNPVSGNCADTVLRTTAGARVPGTNEAWGKLCRLLRGAGLNMANETGGKHSGCPDPKTFKFTDGPHFHVYVPGS